MSDSEVATTAPSDISNEGSQENREAGDTVALGPHVLTITPFYPRAGDDGSGCFVAEPLAEMIQAGLRSAVFAVEPMYRDKPRANSSAPEAAWYRYPSLPRGLGLATAGVGLFWRLRNAVAKLHHESPINLIHAHGPLPCGHAAALLGEHFSIPYVVTVHGLDAFSSVQVQGAPREWCTRVSRRIFQNARRVIGVSRRVCEEVKKGTGGSSTTAAVYNGVDAARFTPGPEPSALVLLTVGNLIPIKGHQLIVRALAVLNVDFPALTWEVIGNGPELDHVRRLAAEMGVLGKIRFLGRRSRKAVADAYQRCTVFVLPSRYEGLGCVYLEAMASAKVAVGCTGQGIEEVIRHGENGWLIAPDSLPQLIEALKILLRDPCRRLQMGRAARETILNGFTLQHQAQRLVSIYRECSR